MTNLEVVNRALRTIGSLPANSWADTAKNAARAITAYPMCRNEMLRMIPWPSCTKRALLKNWDAQATPWTASHRYEIGDRVTNDTAKTYQATVAGISAAAGGPTGTGTAITDGTVTWKYVEASTKLTNWCHWPSTAYVVGDLVSWDTGKVYECITAGTTAAATPPTGVTADITDGTAHWAYYGTPPRNLTVYAYQYVLPPDCLRVLKIPSATASMESDLGVQYLREGNWLYCNQDDSHVRYICREEDPTRWDPLLQDVVALRIAAEIVYDVTGKEMLTREVYGQLKMIFETARSAALHEGAESAPEPERWEDA